MSLTTVHNIYIAYVFMKSLRTAIIFEPYVIPTAIYISLLTDGCLLHFQPTNLILPSLALFLNPDLRNIMALPTTTNNYLTNVCFGLLSVYR